MLAGVHAAVDGSSWPDQTIIDEGEKRPPTQLFIMEIFYLCHHFSISFLYVLIP